MAEEPEQDCRNRNAIRSGVTVSHNHITATYSSSTDSLSSSSSSSFSLVSSSSNSNTNKADIPPPQARSTGRQSPTSSSTPTSNLHVRSSSSSSPAHSSSTSPSPSPTSSSSSTRIKLKKMSPLSPRSSAQYERLESGLGARGANGPRRMFNWKKFAIGAAVLIGVVYFFGPRETRVAEWVKNKTGTGTSTDASQPIPIDMNIGENIHTELPPPPSSHQSPPNTHPTSYETDPDPSSTTHCTSPYKPTQKLVQYALMLDAGSTGSRIHIYKFNNCGSSPGYEYEVFKMTQPGLSSYAGNPEGAAESLDVLLDEALRVVPESLRRCTPVAVKATAGLRLLPGSQSSDILKAVESRLRSKYPFQLPEKDSVVVMDGKDEGVYAWITANYLLKTILPDTPKDTPTYAVLDLGGASTQIVFEPTFSSGDMILEEGEHKYDLEFAGKKHVLYQHSYLGYGLKRARMHTHRLVEFMSTLRKSTGVEVGTVVPNPCLALGTRKVVEVEDESGKRNVTMDGDEVGGFEACQKVVELVLAKDSICELKPCSFNGVYQPSLLHSFPTGKVLLLSYFYDRMAPLLPYSNPPSLPDTIPPFSSPASSSSSPSSSQSPITVSTLATLARTICSGPQTWSQSYTNKAILEELEGRPEWCLDLTFMHALLRMGYEFEETRNVVLGKKIEGTELGWCLGATIAMVGGELRCRI